MNMTDIESPPDPLPPQPQVQPQQIMEEPQSMDLSDSSTSSMSLLSVVLADFLTGLLISPTWWLA
jgi:hypothetical protein